MRITKEIREKAIAFSHEQKRNITWSDGRSLEDQRQWSIRYVNMVLDLLDLPRKKIIFKSLHEVYNKITYDNIIDDYDMRLRLTSCLNEVETRELGAFIYYEDFFPQLDLLIVDQWGCFNFVSARKLIGWYAFQNIYFDLEQKVDIRALFEAACNSNLLYFGLHGDEIHVVEMPEKVIINDRGNLENLSGYAVESGKLKLNFINGILCEPGLYDRLTKGEYTFKDFIKEKNEEVKSMIMYYFQETKGSEAFFDFVSPYLDEIDTYTDIKDPKYLEGTTKSLNVGVYTLFYGEVNDIELSFVRCYCPSTDRMFFLSTRPVFGKAEDAIASLYPLPYKLKDHIKDICRQGERFSTTYTEKGMEIIECMSESDWKDMATLSGDEYFRKMKYEF